MLYKTYFRCPRCRKSWVRRGNVEEETCVVCNNPIKASRLVCLKRTKSSTLADLKQLAEEVANVALSESGGESRPQDGHNAA